MSPPGVYLDNASTSYPKPPVVWTAVRDYLEEVGAGPGRGSYAQARRADAVVQEVRKSLAELFGVDRPEHVVFTPNATVGLNTVIHGVLSGRGGHAVTTNLDHNSVLRPLEHLRRAAVAEYDVIWSDSDGRFAQEKVRAAMRPDTRLVVVTHASNVTGSVLPIREIGEAAHEAGAVFAVDASQTAGHVAVDVTRDGIDVLVFTGHKGLLGPSGTGGMYIRDPAAVDALVQGGTGMTSQSLQQPEVMPHKYEAGTINYLGIAGLGGSLAALLAGDPATQPATAHGLRAACVAALAGIDGVTVYDVAPEVATVPVVSFTVAGLYAGEVAAQLDERYGIMVRGGLHCAPLAHDGLGTRPAHGTVRVSFGPDNRAEHIEQLARAVYELAGGSRS